MDRTVTRDSTSFAARLCTCTVGHLPLALILAGALLGSTSALARTIVLRPDGTGDVLTFQAGVESLATLGIRNLVVMPGSYEEDVVFDFSGGGHWEESTIICPGGRDQTRIRSLAFANEHPSESHFWHSKVKGLSIGGRVTQGASSRNLIYEHCRFEGGFRSTLGQYTGFGVPFFACEFFGRVDLTGYGKGRSLDSCRFVNPRVRINGIEWGFKVKDCVFEGPADTAVVGKTGSDGGIWFRRCTFRGTKYGIVVDPDEMWRLDLTDCVFEDIAEVAVSYTGRIVPNSGLCGDRCYVSGTRFERCGTAVQLLSPRSLGMTISQSSVIDSRLAGIRATLGYTTIDSLVVEGSAGSGVELVTNYSPRQRWCSPTAPEIRVSNSVFVRNGSHGLALLGSVPNRQLARINVRTTTSAENGGAGIFLESGVEVDASAFVMENNLVAFNSGAGIELNAPYRLSARHNDSWMNQGPAYVGIHPDEINLQVDPLFCDPAAGDFQVSSASSCAPSGPYGQIGALGVGCDPARPQGSHAVVESQLDRSTGPTVLSVRPGKHDGIDLNLNLPSAGLLSIEAFDIQGRRVAAGEWRHFGPGQHTVELVAEGLAPGVYLVMVRQGRETARCKAVVF